MKLLIILSGPLRALKGCQIFIFQKKYKIVIYIIVPCGDLIVFKITISKLRFSLNNIHIFSATTLYITFFLLIFVTPFLNIARYFTNSASFFFFQFLFFFPLVMLVFGIFQKLDRLTQAPVTKGQLARKN